MIQTRSTPIIVQVTPGLFKQISHHEREGTPQTISHMEMLAQRASLNSTVTDFPISFSLELGAIQFEATFTIGKERPVLTLAQANMN